MVQATMLEAKTNLSELVRRAQLGEKVILTNGRDKVPVAEIVALEPLKKRPLELFAVPGFKIPADFDDLPRGRVEALERGRRVTFLIDTHYLLWAVVGLCSQDAAAG